MPAPAPVPQQSREQQELESGMCGSDVPGPDSVPPVPGRPLLPPGGTESTVYAARYLGASDQCMRVWACEDSGPIKPIQKGRHALPTADLIRLGSEGWQPRRTKPIA